jgi:hypothetical protein
VICRKGREGHFYWRTYLKKRRVKLFSVLS